ncbi:extracellular solute-binding protein [Paenibacillus doosanensis]|uniref:Bacterial extracellular solute-binding protein n=1 Tax=Paenibacillus konkukensis TaxID=2020716 RepID=A0ABY4RNM9_9BACL|nr:MULTISPECIES: extracellular solute-binding protein [Paenibacillus]MCS7464153.1 extracellular solute-binding protein [Paenibacillus doosanensis]UQZ83790.1 Bacterial extracellular solute-binding protein [Paenibacillus konkukensis]
MKSWVQMSGKIIIASTLAGSLLAGCSGGKQEGEGAGESGKQEPVELVFYQTGNADWTEDDFMNNYGNYIKQKFPNITPKFVPVPASKNMDGLITGGQQFDILIFSIGHTHLNLIRNEFQYDISDLIKKKNVDLSRFEPFTIEQQKEIAGGGIYGLPLSNTSPVLMYNKDIFDKFGVPYPKDGMTWDEVYDLAKQLTRSDNGTQYYGFLASPEHILKTNQFSAPFVDPKTFKPMFDDPKMMTFLDNLKRFYELIPTTDGKPLEGGFFASTAQSRMFSKDKTLAMWSHFSNSAVNFPDDLNWDYASLPYFKELGQVGPQAYPGYIYISKTSKHKDEAMDVIQALTSDEFQTIRSKMGIETALKNPEIKKTFAQDLPKYKGKNIQAIFPQQYAAPAPLTEYNDLAWKRLNEAFGDIGRGKKDIVTAVRDSSELLAKDIQAEQTKKK